MLEHDQITSRDRFRALKLNLVKVKCAVKKVIPAVDLGK